jgi:type VI secretion system protein ImpK
MSDKDNPFGSSGDRTFVRPNPGLRRPYPAPPSPQPTGAPPAYTPETAPAYQPAAASPRPTDTPYGRAPASPYEDHESRAAANAHDDWISSARAPAQVHVLQRAEDLDFDALVAQHENPIMRAAGPLLHLLGRLRVAALRASFASLMEQVAAAINFFDKDIRTAGVPVAQANAAKYLICATADDIVQNIPTDDRHVWAQYSMTSRFFGERLGGVNFFKELDRLKLEPAVNYNVLELQHACLALGFQGKYRATSGGPVQLQHIQRDLYETLRRVRHMPLVDLSPRWKGQIIPQRSSRLHVPLWAIAALAALALLGVFLFLRMKLTESGEAIAANIENLNPATPVALETVLKRTDPPPPQPSAQLKRCENAISGANEVSCTVKGEWIKIRVGAAVLFESGKANVKPQFHSTADAIASYVEKESGPIKVVGYTDSQPLSPLNPFRDNQALSEARAEAASELLRNKLSDPSRLQSEGRGPSEPVGDNATEAGRRQNRRVDVWIRRGDD